MAAVSTAVAPTAGHVSDAVGAPLTSVVIVAPASDDVHTPVRGMTSPGWSQTRGAQARRAAAAEGQVELTV